MSSTSVKMADLQDMVSIDESIVHLLATVQCKTTENLEKYQIRAVILGDFLINSCEMNVTVAINIVGLVADVINLSDTEEICPILEVLDYDTVVFTAKDSPEPLFIANSKGIEIPELSDNPPVMMLTVILSNLFKKYSI